MDSEEVYAYRTGDPKIAKDLVGPYGAAAWRVAGSANAFDYSYEGLNANTRAYMYVHPLNNYRLCLGTGGAGMNNSNIGGGSNVWIDTYNFETGSWEYVRRSWDVVKLSNGWYRFGLTGPAVNIKALRLTYQR